MNIILAALLVAAIMPASSGTGAHGYDWLVGTWTCKNDHPTTIGGPANQKDVVALANGGGLFEHVTWSGYERSGYIGYLPSTKTWFKQISYPNGDYYRESTTQTGKTTVWSGPYTVAATGATMQVRDTYTIASESELSDVGEYQSGGVWKTGYSGTCTKT
jgi:hypothetical protein